MKNADAGRLAPHHSRAQGIAPVVFSIAAKLSTSMNANTVAAFGLAPAHDLHHEYGDLFDAMGSSSLVVAVSWGGDRALGLAAALAVIARDHGMQAASGFVVYDDGAFQTVFLRPVMPCAYISRLRSSSGSAYQFCPTARRFDIG